MLAGERRGRAVLVDRGRAHRDGRVGDAAALAEPAVGGEDRGAPARSSVASGSATTNPAGTRWRPASRLRLAALPPVSAGSAARGSPSARISTAVAVSARARALWTGRRIGGRPGSRDASAAAMKPAAETPVRLTSGPPSPPMGGAYPTVNVSVRSPTVTR